MIDHSAKARHEVIEARAYHVGRLVRRLRPEHRRNMEAIGLEPHRVLRDAFLNSAYCRAALIDGELAAIWGVTGSALSSTGVIWVAFTEAATKYPIIIMRETRRQLAAMAATRRVLESGVIVGDIAAWRFAQRLGFFLKHPTGTNTLSPQTAPLECILAAAPEFKVALPSGGAGVLVGYQGALYG